VLPGVPRHVVGGRVVLAAGMRELDDEAGRIGHQITPLGTGGGSGRRTTQVGTPDSGRGAPCWGGHGGWRRPAKGGSGRRRFRRRTPGSRCVWCPRSPQLLGRRGRRAARRDRRTFPRPRGSAPGTRPSHRCSSFTRSTLPATRSPRGRWPSAFSCGVEAAAAGAQGSMGVQTSASHTPRSCLNALLTPLLLCRFADQATQRTPPPVPEYRRQVRPASRRWPASASSASSTATTWSMTCRPFNRTRRTFSRASWARRRGTPSWSSARRTFGSAIPPHVGCVAHCTRSRLAGRAVVVARGGASTQQFVEGVEPAAVGPPLE
jgi:hypothetical protein